MVLAIASFDYEALCSLSHVMQEYACRCKRCSVIELGGWLHAFAHGPTLP